MDKVEFGTDGIRQIAGRWPLNRAMMHKIGQALGQFVRAREVQERAFVVIGRDTRASGPTLTRWLLAGLAQEGVHVVNLGIMTTPGVAYLTRRLEAELGIVISASHNPPEFNGLKLVGPSGLRLQREEEIEIESLINADLLPPPNHIPVQRSEADHLVELYIQDHIQRCPAGSLGGMKLVLDGANGAAARVAPEVFRRLGAEVYSVNMGEAGGKINQHAGSEHARKHPEDLVQVLRTYGASYGLAFDGDGDRLVVVDAEKHVFDGDDLLFVLSTYFHSMGVLRENAIVITEFSNRGLSESLGRLGIRTVLVGKGDKALEAQIWRGDYLLGGESGGNLIINDGYHTAADAVYSAIVLMGILHTRRASLAELAGPFAKRPQVTASISLQAMPEMQVTRIWEQEKACGLGRLGEQARILTWMSTTEPGIFRIMVEGGQNSTVEQVVRETLALCQTALRAAGNGNSEISMSGAYDLARPSP